VTLNADISSSIHLSEEQLAGYINDIASEIFELMVSMKVTSLFPAVAPLNSYKCGITAMAGFAGTYNGMISIHCPVELALHITSQMLGCTCNEVNDDLRDAIGEVANMLGGSIKKVLSKGGFDVRLSIPTVIFGEEHTANVLSVRDCIVVPFDVEGHILLIGLTLKNEG
jgi:chemotaxis protein CheX